MDHSGRNIFPHFVLINICTLHHQESYSLLSRRREWHARYGTVDGKVFEGSYSRAHNVMIFEWLFQCSPLVAELVLEVAWISR